MQARFLKIIFLKSSLFVLTFLIIPFLLFNSSSCVWAQNQPEVDKTVKLKAVTGLKYDKVRFAVKPGSVLRVILENAGDMPHNMLIVKPETRIEVVKEAEKLGDHALENNYVPNSSNVISHSPLLKPDEEASFTFNVPDKKGIYPYVCTFPAHGYVMYGAIYATNNPDELPPMDEDTNIPESVRNEMATSKSMHPYSMEKPIITRLFMPESSPAAITVGMEKGQSYTWDAGYSFLRYVWDGGYIDASKQWDDKTKQLAKIEGDIYYRNTTGFPFRVGQRDSIPTPDFQGYRIIDGYPRFKYKIGNITVRELILPAESTPGFRIQYTLDNVDQPIWYVLSDNGKIQVDVSKGVVKDNMIKLTPEQAQEFIISFISKE